MARGGYRPGAGRPKGGKTKDPAPVTAAKALQETLAKEGELLPKRRDPLEYMLDVMNDPMADDARRDRLAIAAAPFVHGRAGEHGKKESKQIAAEQAAAGRFAPGAGPRLVVNNR